MKRVVLDAEVPSQRTLVLVTMVVKWSRMQKLIVLFASMVATTII